MSVNKVILIGNVGKDPELKQLQSGNCVVNFPMATSENYTKNGEKQKKTEWHNIVAWDKTAEVISKYVKKGSQIYIEGKITTRSWDDKNGQKKYTTEIITTSMRLLDKKQLDNNQSNQSENNNDYRAKQKSQQDMNFTADDIPF